MIYFKVSTVKKFIEFFWGFFNCKKCKKKNNNYFFCLLQKRTKKRKNYGENVNLQEKLGISFFFVSQTYTVYCFYMMMNGLILLTVTIMN